MDAKQIIKLVKSVVSPLATSTRLMIGRGILRLVEDAKAIQTAQVDLNADETQDGVEIWHQYGIACNPPDESECLTFCVGGQRDNVIAMCPNDTRYRPRNLSKNNVGLYNDKGLCLVLNQSQSATTDVPSQFAARADLVLAELEKIRTAFNAHVHTSAAPGSPTSTPATPMPSMSLPACEGVKIR
jgi:phage baseplate assembly protein V